MADNVGNNADMQAYLDKANAEWAIKSRRIPNYCAMQVDNAHTTITCVLLDMLIAQSAEADFWAAPDLEAKHNVVVMLLRQVGTAEYYLQQSYNANGADAADWQAWVAAMQGPDVTLECNAECIGWAVFSLVEGARETWHGLEKEWAHNADAAQWLENLSLWAYGLFAD